MTALIFWANVAIIHFYSGFRRSDDLNSSPPALYSAATAKDLFDSPPLNEPAIRKVCEETKWNQSLAFTCFESTGGIGNVRNSMLNCIRYTIHAGGTLVLPQIVQRLEGNTAIVKGGPMGDFSYLFDLKHFLDSINLSCPQLKIHMTVADAVSHAKLAQDTTPTELRVKPEDLTGESRIPREGIPHPEKWREQFYTWLDKWFSEHEKEKNSTSLVIVNLDRSYMTYPIFSAGKEFAQSFASMLQFRNDTRILATKTLHALAKKLSLKADLRQPILRNAYVGIHLRTEWDARAAWGFPYWYYGLYDNQLRVFLEQAPRSESKAIYLASGEKTQVSQFKKDVAALEPPRNYDVFTKFDILKGDELEELRNLNFDQQAIIDYLILLKASDFAGVAHSSFAWTIALKRHQYASRQENYLDAPEFFDDDLSKLYGNIKDFEDYPNVLWPR